MKKPLSSKQLLIAFVVCFIVFGIIEHKVAPVIGNALGVVVLILLFVTIATFIKEKATKR